jgi:NAD(P)-dependent dehydrogenase (short-subunit alcohol dehydrogenase family)
VSSSGHLASPPVDWDDLQYTRDWASGRAYCLVKLYNILFTRELARRVAGEGMVANAMHPGVVATNFANHCEPGMKAYMETLDGHPPEVPADTLVWLATSPEAGAVSGGYFHDRRELAPSDAALDAAAAERLWRESEALTAGFVA